MSGANVVLNWQDNSTNELQFYVERCQGAGCTSFIGFGVSDANVATWTDYNAAPGETYSYRVHAWNSDGYSAYSNGATISTSGGTASPPLAPSSLLGQAFSNSQIRTSWTNSSATAVGVKIERCRGTACTNFSQITVVAGTATSYTDSGLASNTTYRYRVRAYNSVGDSPFSNIAAARTLRR
jgi:hypothetical protein